MSIKEQIVDEVRLRKLLRGEKEDKMTFKRLAKEIGMSEAGLNRWINSNGRSIRSEKLEKIAEVLGKKFI